MAKVKKTTDQEVDKWVTINGKHVPIGKDGKIIDTSKKSEGNKKEKSNKAFTFKDANRDFVGPTSIYGLPSTSKNPELSTEDLYKKYYTTNDSTKKVRANADTLRRRLDEIYMKYIKEAENKANKEARGNKKEFNESFEYHILAAYSYYRRKQYDELAKAYPRLIDNKTYIMLLKEYGDLG